MYLLSDACGSFQQVLNVLRVIRVTFDSLAWEQLVANMEIYHPEQSVVFPLPPQPRFEGLLRLLIRQDDSIVNIGHQHKKGQGRHQIPSLFAIL